MASTTKLIVWNGALREIGSAPLADTTTANTRQYELNAAWDHAVEHALAMEDWGFARRRSALAGVADSSFSPYTYRFTKPSDYLRKCWVKLSAANEFQLDHAEVAAAIYAFESAALLEYVSDHSDNYNPANWPPHFTRVLTVYLASLVAPKLARASAGDAGMLDGKMQAALSEATRQEALFLTNVSIAANRQPVFRRALEFLGQQLAGSVPVHAHTDMLRWAMNRAWDHSVRYVLELGAWNFASKRVRFSEGLEAGDVIPQSDDTGMVEGYSYGSDSSTADTSLPPVSEWDYAWALPSDFRHKIWIKPDPNNDFEFPHQFIGNYICCNESAAVMEYVAENTTTTDPANWSGNFLEAVAAYLALTVSPELLLEQGAKGSVRINANDLRGKLEGVFAAKLSDAKLRDAIQQYPLTIPPGRFVRARAGGFR